MEFYSTQKENERQDARRPGIRNDSETHEDTIATNQIETASEKAQDVMVGNIYRKTPAYSLSNANCKEWTGFFNGKNNLWNRAKKWKDEDYYIMESNKYTTLMGALNMILMVLLIVVAFYIWKSNCKVSIEPKDPAHPVSKKTLESLNKWNTILGSYVSTGLALILSGYNVYRIFKRTTSACRSRRQGKVHTTKVHVDQVSPS